MSFIGVMLMGVSIGIFRKSALGVDPFQCFISGLNALIPLNFGLFYSLVNAAMLIFVIICDKHYIGLATFINLFLLGYVAEYSELILNKIFPDPSLILRIVIFVTGLVLLCIASSLYITADMGVSAYDSVALIISETWHKGQFKYVRIISDIFCVITGVICFLLTKADFKTISAYLSAGTIITAFFMGPLIQFFNIHLARPLLNK